MINIKFSNKILSSQNKGRTLIWKTEIKRKEKKLLFCPGYHQILKALRRLIQ